MTWCAWLVFFKRHDGVSISRTTMAFAALDLGARRIGIAVSDSSNFSAHPLRTLDRHRSIDVDIAAIKRTLGSRAVECLIVGLPVNMDGSEGPMARHARNFAARLADATGIAVELQDERLSSFEAEQRLGNSVPRRKRRHAIDAVAAVVILESWLHRHNPASK